MVLTFAKLIKMVTAMRRMSWSAMDLQHLSMRSSNTWMGSDLLGCSSFFVIVGLDAVVVTSFTAFFSPFDTTAADAPVEPFMTSFLSLMTSEALLKEGVVNRMQHVSLQRVQVSKHKIIPMKNFFLFYFSFFLSFIRHALSMTKRDCACRNLKVKWWKQMLHLPILKRRIVGKVSQVSIRCKVQSLLTVSVTVPLK